MQIQKIAAVVVRALKSLGGVVAFGALISSVITESAAAQNIYPPVYSKLSDFEKRTLLIMDPHVVADPGRTTSPCTQPASLQAWSFGRLMKEVVADDAAAVDFIKNWLGHFIEDQHFNGQTVAARDIQKVLNGWQAVNWDIKRAPFQLLAIVNRIDLLRSPLLAGENGGEIRFVFGAVDLSDTANCINGINFTVNLEYGVRQASCSDLKTWAQQWVALGSLDPSDPSSGYQDQLQKLTDTVTWRGKVPTKPNGSAIDHVRTNESVNPPTNGDWQMREFKLDPASRRLIQDTVTLTPMDSLNKSADLTAFLNTIAPGLMAQDYWIPKRFPTAPNKPLLGASATGGIAWQTSPPDAGYLANFAGNTCSGCHVAMPNSTSKTHIDPVMPHDISPFLFDQVQGVRDQDLTNLAQSGCSATLTLKGLVH
jgi:hypothetical protein